ncbi:hypothetical protein AURDEDRAFT_101282 [Auricularia subglabra TFB-10046 SS5]|nr:hypothetical protein AURDEDRAFT_101282 [Auricularia subglabra TFB-10046 SS5]
MAVDEPSPAGPVSSKPRKSDAMAVDEPSPEKSKKRKHGEDDVPAPAAASGKDSKKRKSDAAPALEVVADTPASKKAKASAADTPSSKKAPPTETPSSKKAEKAAPDSSKPKSKAAPASSPEKPLSTAAANSKPKPANGKLLSNGAASKKSAPSPADDAYESDDEHLHGFSTDEDSSDDEDGVSPDAPPVDVAKLPTVAKDDRQVKARLEQAKKNKGPKEDRGVLYLGRIPHGFYEDEMRRYFGQFGEVTRLRLSRNKKTGRSKHYAFIEFESAAVAQIVQETMDNYLLLGHILQCKLIPSEKVHPQLWVGANRKWRVVPRDRVARVKHNRKRTEEEVQKTEERLLARQEAKKRKLAEAGIDYDFDAVAYKKPALGA